MPVPQRAPGFDTSLGVIQDAQPRIVTTLEIPVIHELGPDLNGGGAITKVHSLPPSKNPVIVRVKSQVVTTGAQGLRSPQYMATVRRRKSRELCKFVDSLAEHAHRPDFVVGTYPVVKQINDLLGVLGDAEQEGNSREILRQLRNTFMNGGWNKYRSATVRQAAKEVLNYLTDAEEVEPQQADAAFDLLHAAGLNAVGAPLFPADNEDGDDSGEAEISG